MSTPPTKVLHGEPSIVLQIQMARCLFGTEEHRPRKALGIFDVGDGTTQFATDVVISSSARGAITAPMQRFVTRSISTIANKQHVPGDQRGTVSRGRWPE